MKNLLCIVFIVVLSMFVADTYAQGWVIRTRPAPKWVSDKGFWQVESNISSPKNNTVYFYTNDRVLVYKEEINNVYLDIARMRVRMKLKKALEAAILAWNKKQSLPTDQQWVSALFR